ncbi:hypothetical protein AQUCO_01200214v1 [Aquilegia coerulea]|uniref:DOG1 domain-containing protein n=1 Tax=Aquilegia coerulea TaxID=218851 RepID=A0A2G5E4T7_AQUCA|nr:hypothetical protein AQUCO_01200214v1 [Aquilegia coerulea]
MPNTSSKNASDGICFANFFETWLVTTKIYMDKLNFLSSKIHQEAELESLVVQVLSHYQHYYDTKSRAARENVFMLLSPPWLSTFERAFLWIAGFKPALAFRIVETSVGRELTIPQVEKIEKLKVETRVTEKAFTDEMATIQNKIAGPPMVKIVTRTDTAEVLDIVTGKIKESLRDLVLNADILRTTTTKELVDILSPVQAAKFLAAAAQHQLRIHKFGLQRDAARNAT